MKNTSMTKISGGGLLAEYEYIIWPPFFWISAVVITVLLIDEAGFNFGAAFISLTWILIAVLFTWLSRKRARYVFESADGAFLCVTLWTTEKNLPLSAIESVKIRNLGKSGDVLEVKVKRRSSSSGDFSPGETFWLTPNENYEKSTLFRQFPIPGYYEYEH